MTNQGLILGLGKELHSTIWYGVAMNAFALTGMILGYVRDFITWFGPGAFNLADLWGWVALVLFAFLLIRSKFDFSMIGKTL